MTTTETYETLPSEYDDVLLPQWCDSADRAEMERGCHYDYQAQRWIDGNDHAHMSNSHNQIGASMAAAVLRR